jgi:hypothetical protein
VVTALLLEVVGEVAPLNEWDGEEGPGGGEEELRQVQVPEGVQGLPPGGRVRAGVGHGELARAVQGKRVRTGVEELLREERLVLRALLYSMLGTPSSKPRSWRW